MENFSQKTLEEIKYYVYCLRDPRTEKIFYIGKGKENRIFQHLKCAIQQETESDKLNQIREIIENNHEVEHYILRHGLEEKEAFQIEAILIDLFQTFSDISNIVRGFDSLDRGIKTAADVESYYSAQPIYKKEFRHKVILININKSYKHSNCDVYEATRKSWAMKIEKAEEAEYVLSEYKGVIRKIYKPERWFKNDANKRCFFEGVEVKDSGILNYYLNKQYKDKQQGQANPILYIYPTDEQINQLNAVKTISKNDIKHKVILINISKSYNPSIDPYEATRKSWVMKKEKAEEAEYVFSEYRGVIKKIYQPTHWYKTEDNKRCFFEGIEVTDRKILELYLNKQYADKKRGQANPIQYIIN